ncbi:hypothetical protein OIU77_004956 [Salix suchowensis]|uniref:Uncharacterized protein n=1 Tax=Salix suchowensis TaxID=1278906 RepID=A0ABQ9AYC1_9ROSI|nr:hypothetical protein OIU77_004956 [Salix suchowensis]
MARFGFFFLIFIGILVLQTMADKSDAAQHEGVKAKGVEAEEKPALSPLQEETESREAEAPEIRRLGKHRLLEKDMVIKVASNVTGFKIWRFLINRRN